MQLEIAKFLKMPVQYLLIHTDLHGPLRTQTMSGYCYWITFINDCTSFQAVMFLKAKSEAFLLMHFDNTRHSDIISIYSSIGQEIDIG